MNLTEKIIKGIMEAEFEINPELQKKQKDKAFTRGQMAEAFIAKGWTLGDSFSNVDNTSVYVYTNDNFPGVTVRMIVRNVTKLVFKNMLVVTPGSKWGSKRPATPNSVGKLTQELKDHFAELEADDEKSTDRQQGVTDQVLYDAFVKNGWGGKNVGQSGSLVSYQFTHPKIYGTSFHTTYDVSSGMTKPNMYLRYEGKPGQKWFDATPETVTKATANMLKKLTADDDVGLGEAAALMNELNAVGWDITASSGTGVMVYEHPGVEDQIEILDDADGKILKAVVAHPGGSDESMSTDVESIVKTAQKLAAAGGQS